MAKASSGSFQVFLVYVPTDPAPPAVGVTVLFPQVLPRDGSFPTLPSRTSLPCAAFKLIGQGQLKADLFPEPFLRMYRGWCMLYSLFPIRNYHCWYLAAFLIFSLWRKNNSWRGKGREEQHLGRKRMGGNGASDERRKIWETDSSRVSVEFSFGGT